MVELIFSWVLIFIAIMLVVFLWVVSVAIRSDTRNSFDQRKLIQANHNELIHAVKKIAEVIETMPAHSKSDKNQNQKA